nr:hypothetical protein CFP56_75784 [Quercus suber]
MHVNVHNSEDTLLVNHDEQNMRGLGLIIQNIPKRGYARLSQPQQARLTDCTPPTPPPSSGRQKKKQHLDDHPARTTSKAPVKTPPRPSGGIVILEPVSDTQPAAPSGTEVASSSQAVPNWQPTFMLGGAPLRATTSVKIWAQGEGGRVAESLTAPLTHILGERASELVEDAEQEKALKEVAIDTDRDKVKEAEIPCLAVALPVQSQVEAADDKDTPSMKALVEAINTHIENPDMEATSNLNAPGHAENQRPTTEDAAGQISDDIVQLFQTNLAV